jgi:hypothetical protein
VQLQTCLLTLPDTPYQRRAYLIMTLVLGAVATAEHVHL